MAKNRPVTNWVIKHNPRREPKFHRVEIFDGVGKSINALFMILIKGWDLRRFIINFFL